MALLQGLVEGVTSAMSPAVAQENVKKRADRRATAQEEVQAQAQSILTNVKGVQDKISALGPNPDPNQLGQYQAQLHSLRQDWTDLFHPVKNPGNLGVMGKILQSFRGQQGPTALTAERMARGDVSGAPAPDEKSVGLSREDIVKRNRIGAGLEPRAAADKYQSQLTTTTDDQGKQHYWRVPLNPGESPEEVDFQGQKVQPKGKAKIREAMVPDPTSETGWAKEGYDESGQQVYRVQNVMPQRGGITSQTTTTDPFGVTSTSTRTPIFPGTKTGVTPQGEGAKPAKPTAGTPRQAGVQKKELESKVSKKEASAPKLDTEGHIPVTEPVNQQLRAAANNLLDGMDVDKLPIPQRDRAAAQELAEKYGWKGQGLFTPKDQLLLRESATYLNQAMNDPSLKVLNSATSRLKLMNALNDKPGLPSDILASTWKLSDDEADFLSMYRQLVGTISGLGQLTRANRTTEAGIKRLMAELPNPREVQNADQAKMRIKRLQSELTVAQQKGYIAASPEGTEGNAEPKVLKFNQATGQLE